MEEKRKRSEGEDKDKDKIFLVTTDQTLPKAS